MLFRVVGRIEGNWEVAIGFIEESGRKPHARCRWFWGRGANPKYKGPFWSL